MKDKISIIAIVLSVISIIISIVAMTNGGTIAASDAEVQQSPQYVMYIGTNDKDTYAPKYSEDEARDIVDKVCLKYFEGYTLQEAIGSWTDEKSNITHEYTLVCYFDDTDKETVHKAADELLEKLNQNTILIEEDEIQMEYYSGGN